MNTNKLLSDFLTLLRVPHTSDYTDSQFASMPFKSLFGLSKLLEKYGVESEGLKLSQKSEILHLEPPFLAHTKQGFLIIADVDDKRVRYITEGVTESIERDEFNKVWDGVVFLAFPNENACEPDYAEHARTLLFGSIKKLALIVLSILMGIYLFISNHIYTHATTILLTVLDLIGLTFSFMLLQKSLKIKSHAADKVCGVIEEGGCDTVLETKASSFYGIFSWSEVGFAYFSVSLGTLLIFPQFIGYLALCNVCCLPFSFWSVWYQKFRAKAWCTLCLSIQGILWLSFACYLIGGWFKDTFPLHVGLAVLIASYGLVLLGLNHIMPLMSGKTKTEFDSSSQNVTK